MGDLIGYARVSTADQDPRMQLDALSAGNCLKTYTDTATGTKADRPQWNACLADLRPGDTLVIWKIDRLGRNLRDLIDIVTTLAERHVGVNSLTNGIVDTTTAHGKLVFGMFALMAEYEAALIQERTQAGLVAARARGRHGGRTEDDPRAGRQIPADVRLTPLHHGRDRPILRGQPDDDLPPHRQRPDARTFRRVSGLWRRWCCDHARCQSTDSTARRPEHLDTPTTSQVRVTDHRGDLRIPVCDISVRCASVRHHVCGTTGT